MNSQAGSDVELEDRPCGAWCCCTTAFRLCYLDNVTAAGTTPPTVQDTGNPIICLLMCGNFTLSFLKLWLELCLRAKST